MKSTIPNQPFSVISGILTAALATAGTATVTYPLLQPGTANPATKNKGNYFGCQGHKLVTQNAVYEYPKDFELTFNAADVTVTWRNATTLLANTVFRLQLNEASDSIIFDDKFNNSLSNVSGSMKNQPGTYVINLTSPKAKSTTGVAAAQARGAAGNMTLNGVQAVGGVVYLDVPRAVDIVSANAGDTTQTATVTGTDIYGQAMSELIAFNGTTRVLGKKAFSKITQIAVSAASAGNISAGTVDILGIPVFLPVAGYIIKELENGAAPTAGTVAVGAVLTPTTTTADVRGTYLPNNACDGTKALQLIVALNELSPGGAQA